MSITFLGSSRLTQIMADKVECFGLKQAVVKNRNGVILQHVEQGLFLRHSRREGWVKDVGQSLGYSSCNEAAMPRIPLAMILKSMERLWITFNALLKFIRRRQRRWGTADLSGCISRGGLLRINMERRPRDDDNDRRPLSI